jgi:acetaldehyde dehydrogenase (acetylating)
MVNTGSAQGGTGASTGLLPSFTLGCGTWGGSSVSENVSPMHLINIKRVAYGLKDCATLATEDPSFNYPELSCCTSSCSKGSNEMPSGTENGVDNERLAKLLSELISAVQRG